MNVKHQCFFVVDVMKSSLFVLVEVLSNK